MSKPMIGVLGMARSGSAAARLALQEGHLVYISDSGDTPALREVANTLQMAGAEVELGGHSIEKLAQCELIVVSPGIPPTAAVLQDSRLNGIKRVSELEFAFCYLNAPVIAVTGTNGKSTTTALTSHLLRRAGLDAPAAGNIGIALSEIALREEHPDWVVVEASSYQLADIEQFTPRIGVVTNLAPDHLDRYPSVEAYYADKAQLFRNATTGSVWILNGDDPAASALPGNARGRRFYFRTSGELKPGEIGGFINSKQDLVLRLAGDDSLLVRGRELPLLGRHNLANALAAAIVAATAEIPLETIHDGLISFRGLPHRLEMIAEIDGVTWINDSKATNVASTRVALESMTGPTILLLGGRHKGEPYTTLLNAMRDRVRHVLAYGEAAAEVVKDLDQQVAVEQIGGSFEDVVERAAALAEPGDTVLLSPACASFDMFENYEHRGDRFRELVARLREVVNGR
jgi:UDP-N-acetylmuramoylalanine--D-glutamate ligase